VAEPAFTQAFLCRSIEVEKIASTSELELFDRTLARIVENPYLRERFPTFYDPQHPTFLLRAGPYLFEFAVGERTDGVTFVSLFHRP
jgi:hypothetical protein